MSKSRKIGSGYEVYILDKYLKRVWPNAERSPQKGVNDYGDFVNVSWLVEAKKRKKLQGEIISWVNTALSKTRWAAQRAYDGERVPLKEVYNRALIEFPWVIICAGDKRNQPDIDLAILPAEVLIRLLEERKYA